MRASAKAKAQLDLDLAPRGGEESEDRELMFVCARTRVRSVLRDNFREIRAHARATAEDGSDDHTPDNVWGPSDAGDTSV